MALPLRRASKPGAAPAAAPEQALAKLGLVRDIDLALHLPLRYEDETRDRADRDARATATPARSKASSPIRGSSSGRAGSSSSRSPTTAATSSCASSTSIRRQQKALAVGKRVRVRGEARGGFFGCRDGPSVVQGRDAGNAVADRADAGLSEHRPALAGRRCARRSPPAWRAPISTSTCLPASFPPGLPTPARCARASARAAARTRGGGARGPHRTRPGSGSSSTSCSRSSCRRCSHGASASASARRRWRRHAGSSTTRCSRRCRSR